MTAQPHECIYSPEDLRCYHCHVPLKFLTLYEPREQ